MTTYTARRTITDDLLDGVVTIAQVGAEGSGVLGLQVGDDVTYWGFAVRDAATVR